MHLTRTEYAAMLFVGFNSFRWTVRAAGAVLLISFITNELLPVFALVLVGLVVTGRIVVELQVLAARWLMKRGNGTNPGMRRTSEK